MRGGQTMTIYSVGLDIENKNNHFIHLNLADYSYLFGDNKLYETLDKLPRPDLIIASPPCESWSIASHMVMGNACWKQERDDESLFAPQTPPQTPLSPFTVRDYNEYDKYSYIPERQIVKRINGELCAYNLIQIIKQYNPKYYVIENPERSKIWEYIDRILGFKIPYENLVHYNQYDDYPIQKPTRFKSNVELKLKTGNKPSGINFYQFRGYNNRSNIPINLVKSIFNQILEMEGLNER